MAVVSMEKKFSKKFNKKVLVIHEKEDFEYIDCSCCGKGLKNFYTIQDLDTDVELAYVGSECIKKVI